MVTDFATIRARMEELRREPARVPADDDLRRTVGPQPYAICSKRVRSLSDPWRDLDG
jgi:hypothetical protein